MNGRAAAVGLLGLLGVFATGSEPGERLTGAHLSGGSAFLEAAVARSSAPVQPARADRSVTYEYERRPGVFCGTARQEGWDAVALCVDESELAPLDRRCEDGSDPVAPLFRRALDAATGGVVEEWRQVDNGGCPEDPAADVVLNAEEFRRLPLRPAEPVIQPSDGRALVNLGVAVHTDDVPQELATTVLGVPVVVRATPVRFSWDFGDGTPVVVTTRAGYEYPHQATIGEYPEPGTYELRLTTAWRGEFQVNGTGPWLPVAGTATTTSASVSITVETAPARLYADR